MINGTQRQNSGGVGYKSNYENNVCKYMNLFRPLGSRLNLGSSAFVGNQSRIKTNLISKVGLKISPRNVFTKENTVSNFSIVSATSPQFSLLFTGLD